MRHAFYRVGQRVGKIVKGINAPLCTLTVVGHVQNAVKNGIPQFHIGMAEVNFGPEHMGAIWKFAFFHAFK